MRQFPNRINVLTFVVILVSTIVSFNSCEDNAIAAYDLPACDKQASHYIFFKMDGQEYCWNELEPTIIDYQTGGKCGRGYEGEPNPYLTMGIRGYICSPSTVSCKSVDQELVFNFSYGCDAFDTQDKFYALLRPGNYPLAKSSLDFGKLYVDYLENGTWYTTRTGDQSNSKATVTMVTKVTPNYITLPGGYKTGDPASLEVTLKAAFSLYDASGIFFKRVSGVEATGRYYRPSPKGMLWDDYYGE